LGIAVIHQELSLIGSMSVADNLFLGDLPVSAGGWVNRSTQIEQARQAISRVGLDLDVRRPVEDFPIAVQQMIEIAKALNQNARVIVMDEPTSALSSPEVDRFFERIARLKAGGCGIVYITHRMEEIERIADRITVLRDGRHVGTEKASVLPAGKLIQWMVGREITEQIPSRPSCAGRELLRVEQFSVFPDGDRQGATVRNASLTLRVGEVVGIGGLQGSGASDLLLGLFGAYAGTPVVASGWKVNRFRFTPRGRPFKTASGFSRMTGRPPDWFYPCRSQQTPHSPPCVGCPPGVGAGAVPSRRRAGRPPGR